MSIQELLEAVIEDMTQVQTIYYKKIETKQGLALDILPKYLDFKHLSKKEADEDALLPHQPQDHEINLKEGAVLKREPLQLMLAKKAKYVRKYVKDGLQKGHLRESESPIGFVLHIVPKTDKQYICIDY